jgi:hypothetical protein
MEPRYSPFPLLVCRQRSHVSDNALPETPKSFLRYILSFWWMPALVGIERLVDDHWLQAGECWVAAIAFAGIDYWLFVKKEHWKRFMAIAGMVLGLVIFAASAWFYLQNPKSPTERATQSGAPGSATQGPKAPYVYPYWANHRFNLVNNGDRAFYIYGQKTDGNPAHFLTPPSMVPPKGDIFVPNRGFEDGALNQIGPNGKLQIPFEIYFLDEDKKTKFTGKFGYFIVVQNGVVEVRTQSYDMIPGGW